MKQIGVVAVVIDGKKLNTDADVFAQNMFRLYGKKK
jgi:hypothetical protein